MIYVCENATYKLNYGRPEIILYSRSVVNPSKLETHIIRNFEPYFYAPPGETTPEDIKGIKSYSDTVEIDAIGREVVKITTHKPSDVKKVRDYFTFTDMADFLFEKRFLVDKGIKYAYRWDGMNAKPITLEKSISPRVVYFDIEVLTPEGDPFPDAIYTKYPVVSIQTLDTYTNKTVIFTYKVPQTSHPDHIACNTEEELFNAFMAYLERVDPDLLTGWSSSFYDLPYLIRRSWKLHVNVDNLGRHGTPRCEYIPEENEFNLHITGRSTLDMIEAFKKFMISKSQRESYDLKSVSADYGFEYTDWGPNLYKLFDSGDWDTFLDYCRNDVIALQNIDDSVKLIDFYENLRMIAGCKLDDVLYNSRVIEMLLLHNGMKPMPTKTYVFNENKEKYKGAEVLLPPPGIHENVATVDLAALYPTIMRAFPKETCPDIDLKIIDTLEMIVAKREELRQKRKAGDDSDITATQENIYKAIANSFYGVIGSPAFRLFKRECALFVTSTGIKINRMIHEKLRSENYSVLYSDTDSSFFAQIKTVEEGFRIQDMLNNHLTEWGKQNGAQVVFSLKFEKLYKKILFKKDSKGDKAAKKRYVGHLIWEEGRDTSELNYKGLELKRSDNSAITKEILETFLTTLLVEDNRTVAIQYIQTMYKKVKSGEIDLLEISIPKAIRKISNTDNPWKRGIRNTQQYLSYNIPDGVKPRLIYVTRHPYELCIDDEIDIGEWKNYIDWDKTLEKNVTKKLQSYVESAGFNWDHFIHGQKSLMDFFK